MLGAFTTELDRIAPRFEIQGSKIQILHTPSEFYETLKVGIHFSKLGKGNTLMGVGQDIGSRKSHISVYIVHRENRTRACIYPSSAI
jgi:hypothetical protein